MAAGLTGVRRRIITHCPVSWKPAVAAVASLALTLAACGGGGPAPGPAASTGAASTGAAAAPAASIEVTATEAPAVSTSAAASTAAPASTASATAARPADAAAAAGEYEVSFTLEECPFRPLPGADPQCGYLSVPANRSRPEEGRIRLAAAVFPARSEEIHPPVVYLEGGPGGEALASLPFSYETLVKPLDAERTVIVFDQRGVGYSEPSLSCPEIRLLTFDLLDEDLPDEEWLARYTAVLHECRQTWVNRGIDLSNFNSAASAADVADLRAALGYGEWDLYGISYGTRLALTVMRDHPEGIRSVVLDSAYPHQVDEIALALRGAAGALDELFSACAADPYCSSAYGDLETLLFSAVERLDESPAEIEVIDYFTFRTYPALLDGGGLLSLVFLALYSEWSFPRIPRALAEIQDGRYSSAEELLSLFLANSAFLSVGMNVTIGCREEVPFSDPGLAGSEREAHPRLAPLVEGSLFELGNASEFCAAWGAGKAGPIENQPVTSSIPALVMAGRFDPVTPPDYGRRTAEHLGGAWLVEFPTLAHGVSTVEGCPRSIMLDFLADPADEPDTACLADMPRVLFP